MCLNVFAPRLTFAHVYMIMQFHWIVETLLMLLIMPLMMIINECEVDDGDSYVDSSAVDVAVGNAGVDDAVGDGNEADGESL